MKLISVVISGGAGTRLWPASRQSYPKPFLSLGGSPLLQQAIERGQACGADESLIVTNQDYLFLTREVIANLQDPPNARYILRAQRTQYGTSYRISGHGMRTSTRRGCCDAGITC
jgi:mannose-1-phosphate guanylyltransferase/mannose-6-phosphate isomerase